MKKLLLGVALWLGLLAPAFGVLQSTKVGNVAYSILPTDTNIVTTTALSTGRTWTLPYAAGSCIGQNCSPAANALQILDAAGAISSTGQLTIAPQSGETINGNAANLILTAAGVRVVLIPTSSTNWQATIYGDYQVSTIAVANVVSLTSTTAANITSLSLSQGYWSCSGVIHRNLAASTSVTQLKTSISATTATSGTLDLATMVQWSTAANVMAADTSQIIGPVTLNLAATATYYLVAQDTFSVSTDGGYGQLICRRIR